MRNLLTRTKKTDNDAQNFTPEKGISLSVIVSKLDKQTIISESNPL